MWLVECPFGGIWHIELGSGVGWSSPYDPIERPLSIAIGSRLNAAIPMAPRFRWFSVSKAGWLLARGSPIFNGALALPNLGINNVHLVFAQDGRRRTDFPNACPPLGWTPRGGWHWACAGRIGARDINLPGGVLHPTVSVGAYAQRKATATHSWVLAVDLAHNQSLRQFGETPLSMPQKLQLSSLAGVNLHFGHAQLMLPRGGYGPDRTKPSAARLSNHFGLCCSPFLGHRDGIAFLSHSGRLPVHRHTIQPSCIPLIRGKWCRMHRETSGDHLYSPDRPG